MYLISISRIGIMSIMLALVCSFSFHLQTEVNATEQAADFSLVNLSGQTESLSQYRGHVVILDFWASWCPPCRKSIPHLVELDEKYRDRGLIIIGVSLDDPARMDDQRLKAFAGKFKITYSILRGNKQVLKDYFGQSSPALPTLFVIDKEGSIQNRFIGHEPEALEKAAAGLLN